MSKAAASPRATSRICAPRSLGSPGPTPAGSAAGRSMAVMTVIRSRSRRGLERCPVVAWPAKPAPWRHRIKSMRMSRRDRRSAGLGAIAGVLAAGTALGVGQLVAGLTGASGSPVVAVGELQIDFTPPWLKNFAIREFGADDKLILVSGILVVLTIFAAVIGAAATRRMAYGMVGLGVFAVVGLTAAATRPTATVTSLLPTLAATAAAVAVLRLLIPM